MKVFGDADIDAMVLRLNQAGDRARKHVVEKMRDYAEEVRDKAIDFAPVKDGHLHDAIRVRDAGGGRDSGGRFQRKSVEVYVDPNATGVGGRPVIAYAWLMHEGLGPYGDYTYGARGLNVPWRKASAAHDGGRGVVGGKFLTRALEYGAQEFVFSLSSDLRGMFR